MFLKKCLKFSFIFFISLFFYPSICWGADDEDEAEEKLPKMTLVSKDDVKEHPHSAVISLVSYFRNGTVINRKIGTGFLIDNHFILTAAHVVFNKGEGAKQIFFYKNRHGSSYEFKEKIEKYAYPVKYVDEYLRAKRQADEKRQEIKPTSAMMTHDYALLYFGEGIKFLEPIEPTPMSGKIPSPFMFCGYPGEDYNKVEGERRHDFGSYPYECEAELSLYEPESDLVGFSTHSYPGMSGGPVRFSQDEEDDIQKKWQAFAIQSAGRKDQQDNPSLPTVVCCLTEQKLDIINQCKKTCLTPRMRIPK